MRVTGTPLGSTAKLAAGRRFMDAVIRVRCVSKTRRLCSSCSLRESVIIANSEHVVLLYFRPRVLRMRPSPVIGIFFSVDRCHMGWILIKVRSPDSELLAVCVDPFPQTFACNESLLTCLALYADKVSSKPMTVTPAKASTVV